jgi:hypothetical protein
MHRRQSHRPLAALAALLLAGLAWLPMSASAAVVAGLYEGVVPGDTSEDGRAAAAQEALRQVAVRATGRRAAASDPALAGLYAEARRYAQTFQPVGGGYVAVGFDPDAVEAALGRAGLPIWGRERPSTLVVLVADRPGQPRSLVGGTDAEERRAVERAAQLRGLPLVWPGALDPVTAQQRIDDVLANRGEALREFARRYGADGVLYGRATPAGVAWNWLAGTGAGSAHGTLGDGVDALADRLAAEFASGQARAAAVQSVVVRGVGDLRAYADTLTLLLSLPNVRAVALESAAGDVARFRIDYRGDPEALRRSATLGGRLAADADATGDGALRLVLQP